MGNSSSSSHLPAGSIHYPAGFRHHSFRRSYHPNGQLSVIQETVDGEDNGLREEYDEQGRMTGCWTVIKGTRYLREPTPRQGTLPL